MRAPPSTLEVVEARAWSEPQRPALYEGGVQLGYGQLANQLLQCAQHLRTLGVRRGERVAVAGPGFGIQIVVLLACEAIGAVTASFEAHEDTDASELFKHVDWVFSALPQDVPPGVRFVRLDAALARRLAQPFAAEMPRWEPAGFDEPQRLTRTSGSTGASKFMLLRRQAQESWIHPILDVAGYDPGTRLLLLGPLVANAIYGRASDCLREGGLVMVGEGRDIGRLQPTHVYGLPLQLELLLAQLPAGYVAPHPVKVTTMGGFAPPQLRQRARAVFHTEPGSRYGSNEAHIICVDLDAEGAGVLCPGVEVRILGPGGDALPTGQPGVIAVRTPAMADGYLGRPEESAAAFRDGWFVSGDFGALVGPRRLQLLGRTDELLNLGGVKVPTVRVEDALREQPAFQDVAVLGGSFAGGATLGIAAVLAPAAAAEDVLQAVRSVFGPDAAEAVRVLRVPALPRLPSGKVDRPALLEALRRA
ncbi:class I adenylate-forming enzyme family protein [Ramlibacter pallidus]|uniref:Acyl--CoA ligase n=1 Tax=Ramlibacter pallidus TaxID=2780087 RepID=A0ABR9S8R1_9BURK|nr:class I adenylate-forming enzyme family protein [Ramlibacter pallidus]MBE7369888.1 acyl--CoA ligase [Ramlibacter pallidus]